VILAETELPRGEERNGVTVFYDHRIDDLFHDSAQRRSDGNGAIIHRIRGWFLFEEGDNISTIPSRWDNTCKHGHFEYDGDWLGNCQGYLLEKEGGKKVRSQRQLAFHLRQLEEYSVLIDINMRQ
jgi:hypothetical protein